MSLKKVSLVATSILTVAVLSLFFRRALFAHGVIPITLQVVAGLLMLWARLTFGVRSFHAGANPTDGGLVMTGPYRLVRHPIYTALLLFMWAGIASHGATLSVLTAIVATAAIAVRIGAEEQLVVEAYPEYAEYVHRTKRIIPFVL
ncbi:MAG: methyltransferase family protein [Gemmatimonadales bacterium]